MAGSFSSKTCLDVFFCCNLRVLSFTKPPVSGFFFRCNDPQPSSMIHSTTLIFGGSFHALALVGQKFSLRINQAYSVLSQHPSMISAKIPINPYRWLENPYEITGQTGFLLLVTSFPDPATNPQIPQNSETKVSPWFSRFPTSFPRFFAIINQQCGFKPPSLTICPRNPWWFCHVYVPDESPSP